MIWLCLGCLIVLFVCSPLDAQTSLEGVKSPVISPPRLLYKVEPEYSSEARAEGIQGTVLLQVIVSERGRAENISVVSPMGFGLDEQAQAAIEKWEFAPAIIDGRPVAVAATIEVTFRLPGRSFDEKAEARRTTFNLALQTLRGRYASAQAIKRAVQSIKDLSKQKFAPAMWLAGMWLMTGEHLPQDPAQGLALIQKAAAKNHGPALYEIANRHMEGRDLAMDTTKGLTTMQRAAVLGSPQAQLFLGGIYENGNGVPRELDRARRYYRLCAARGFAVCQYRLGTLLLVDDGLSERDYVQAVAWLQLACEQGLSEATDIASKETAKLTPAQTDWMNQLKPQLVRR
jgi:TonB family protein